MDRPYVEELCIQNYGCIRDATFRFTPLHALIGPNDSGKSTVLRALLTLQWGSWPQRPVPFPWMSNVLQRTKARESPGLQISTSTKSTWWLKSQLQNNLPSGAFL